MIWGIGVSSRQLSAVQHKLRYLICSKLVNEVGSGGGIKNSQNCVNVVYEWLDTKAYWRFLTYYLPG